MARRLKGGTRLYLKNGRFYAYLRDLGGGQEALKPPGSRYATTDPDIAAALLAKRVKELEAERRGLVLLGPGKDVRLDRFIAHHLEEKAKVGKVSEGWLAAAELRFRRALEHFGAGKPVAAISVADMNAYRDELAKMPGRGGKTMSGGTQRHHLNDMSNLFRRAQGEGVVPPGWNPVASMMEKPSAARNEARWLEPHEAALILEAARRYKPDRKKWSGPVFEAVATMLLTGGRRSEVLGRAVDDVSFERRAITFRPHPWRRLKTQQSHRSVPLFPQLEEILRAYLDGPKAPKGKLLFPTKNPLALANAEDGVEPMITDLRAPLDEIAKAAGWAEGEIRTKMFRHSYCAARLQTLDRGAPVSEYTVAREMGHGGHSMVRRVYGHLGDVRHRSEVVEYRPDMISRIPNARMREAFTRRLRLVRGEAA